MKLSKLAYLCVKNVIYLNEPFNYREFLIGAYDDDPDFDTNINNVFSPINEAIARLNDLERIPYKVKQAKLEFGTKNIDLSNLMQAEEGEVATSANVKEMIAVGQMIAGKPIFLEFKHVGNKILVLDGVDIRFPLYIEYKEDIPNFSREDIPEKDPLTEDVALDVDGEPTPDVDLKDYNINDSLCNYITEYAQGKLEEQIAPELANMHITRAETYFNNIRPVSRLFAQRVIKNVYRIGE